MNGKNAPVIPWDSDSTASDWQSLIERFGFVAIELYCPVDIPYSFRRSGAEWDGCILKIVAQSSLQEIAAQRDFLGISSPYPSIGNGNVYRVVAEWSGVVERGEGVRV